MKQDAIIKNMKFSTEKNLYFTETQFPEEIEKDLDDIVRFIAGRTPRDLELLASVHFWAVRQQDLLDKYTTDYILDKLSELKPDAAFIRKNVEYAIETLESRGYLKAKNS